MLTETYLAATQTPSVSTRAQSEDTVRKRTPLMVAEGSGLILPYMPETGAIQHMQEKTRKGSGSGGRTKQATMPSSFPGPGTCLSADHL